MSSVFFKNCPVLVLCTFVLDSGKRTVISEGWLSGFADFYDNRIICYRDGKTHVYNIPTGETSELPIYES